MRSAICLAAVSVFASVPQTSLAAERLAAAAPLPSMIASGREASLGPGDARGDRPLERSCSRPLQPSTAICVSLAATESAPAGSTPGRNLGMAYTQRFLPGFAVTVDRAPSMLTGFVTGLGRSIAQGRNCFAGACSFGPSTMLDSGDSLVAEATEPANLRRALAEPADLAGVSLGYGLDIGTGTVPTTIHASAARLFDAPPATMAQDGADDPSQSTTGASVGLALRHGALELGVARQRLRLHAGSGFAGIGDDSRVDRQELRVAWQLTTGRLSLVLAEARAFGDPGEQDGAVRSAGLQFEFPLR